VGGTALNDAAAQKRAEGKDYSSRYASDKDVEIGGAEEKKKRRTSTNGSKIRVK